MHEEVKFPLYLPRKFATRSYDSHSNSLLLRSLITNRNQTRVDILFQGVTEIRLRSFMDCITINMIPFDHPSVDEFFNIQDKGSGCVFSVAGIKFDTGYVIAKELYISEDTLSDHDPITINSEELRGYVLRSGHYIAPQ
ncbi:hypothetical protein [Longimycelium tulufanense]|nr:hypothetical protein [Longimycelium tulufanense]